MNNNDNGHAGSSIAAFVAGAAAALLAGGYFLYGPDGKRHRKQTKAFVSEAREALLERMSQAERLTERGYKKLLNEVAKAQDLTSVEARHFVDKFKNKFEELREESRASAEQAELEMEEEE